MGWLLRCHGTPDESKGAKLTTLRMVYGTRLTPGSSNWYAPGRATPAGSGVDPPPVMVIWWHAG